MMEFFSFSSGSCGNCSYIGNGRDALLIDAGVGVRKLKKDALEYGIRMQLVRGILITHDHADHIKMAGRVSQEFGWSVFTTARIHEGMRHNFRSFRKVEPARVVAIEKQVPFQVGSLRVTAFDIPHDATENVGYCIESDGEVFTLMTDVGAPTEAVRSYIGRSDYVVLEADYDEEMLRTGSYPQILKDRIASGTGHLSNTQTAQLLADCFHDRLQRVWLCHLSGENNRPELARQTVEAKLRERGIVSGRDFRLEVLGRGVPSGPWRMGRQVSENLQLS